MNQRFFLALILTAIVIVATPLVFPGARHPDSAQAANRATVPTKSATSPTTSASPVTSGAVTPQAQAATPASTTSLASTVETTSVHTRATSYVISSRGAAITSVSLDSFVSRRPGRLRVPAQVIAPNEAVARISLALGRDTVALDTILFQQAPRVASGTAPVEYTGTAAGHAVTLRYTFATDTLSEYTVHTALHVDNAPAGSVALLELPRTLFSNEPDTLDDMSHLALSYRTHRGDIKSEGFSKLDSTEVKGEAGPIDWVAARNKYFLVAFRAPSTPFSLLRLQGAPRPTKVATHALSSASLPLSADGSASFDTYAGPQAFERLERLGNDLEQVNPYAGFAHGLVQPVATMVMKSLLWLKRTTQLNYGWVLVLFGVFIRLVLWPLNQNAMRSSMKMQALQPELQAVQKRNADDPAKQQEAIMKLYKEHGMSPLSPLMGCLPMLLPMPVFFALYYVFGNTIEFRGVPFLWLPDISLKDPYYITPLLTGVSMFVMSWVGMRNSPPNPQAKMMSYMMPVMLTVLFLNFASGLNLYYAVQNIASIPQQWLLARERAKPVVKSGPVATTGSPRRA